MDNIVLIAFTIVLVISFTAFGISTFAEFKNISEENNPNRNRKSGIISVFLRFLGKNMDT